MSSPSWMERTGATPKKLALIAVLAVVLVAVLWHQAFGAKEAVAVSNKSQKPVSTKPAATSPQTKNKTKATDPASRSQVVEQQPDQSDYVVTMPDWQEMALEEVLAYDPFQVPEWYVLANQLAAERVEPATVENMGKLLEQLREKPTNIVVISGGQKVATIGGQEVRVGDFIEGFRVTEITTEGITLSEVKTR